MHTDTAGRTVLVVDDNPAIVALLSTLLVGEGYRVVTALARETVQCAREWAPAVILLDIAMPELDGVQVCERLRDDPRTAAIPIIALSAQLNLHIHAAAMQADAYVAKPFDISALVAVVDTWVGTPSPHATGDERPPATLLTPAPARGALRERLAAATGDTR